MVKFNLSACVTVSTYTTVEAESLSEAIKIAEERTAVIGGNCSGESPAESWIVEEIDGSPINIYCDSSE